MQEVKKDLKEQFQTQEKMLGVVQFLTRCVYLLKKLLMKITHLKKKMKFQKYLIKLLILNIVI